MVDLKEKKIIALLPMRMGSKRIFNKNLRKLGGKPLYKIIIDKLLMCKYIDKICINTDINSIINKYKKNNRFIIIDRPKKFSGNCNINLIIKSCLDKIDRKYFIQVHCTNPFLKYSTIDKNIKAFLTQNYFDSYFSVNKFQKRLWNSKSEPYNHKLNEEPTTQNLNKLYNENSCFYIFSKKSFFKNMNRIGKRAKMIVLPQTESFDLDEEDDYNFAKIIHNKIK